MTLTPIQMRRAFDKSREEVAKLLDIHPNTLDKLEKTPSKFSFDQAEKLCKLYNDELIASSSDQRCTIDDFSFLP